MRATPLAAIAALFFAALCAFAPGAASAQQRDTVYVVSGVSVDETAANAAEAQAAGFAAAHRQAFERLVRRVTTPAELAARGGVPALDPVTLERLVMSVDVQEQRRSATRYIGRLSVRFNADAVRALLQQQSLAIVETRTSPVLVAPVLADGADPETAAEMLALWRNVWAEGGFDYELVPLAVASESLQGPPSWQIAQPHAQSGAATSVLYAALRLQGGAATATLVEVDATGARDRGTVTAPINGGDTAALRAALTSLAHQANAPIQDAWKARLPTTSGERGRISASALYSDQAQWERIKDALEGAAATLISQIRIEAVGRQGALVSFSFTGDRSQLAAELARRGVQLQDSPQGPVLRVAGR